MVQEDLHEGEEMIAKNDNALVKWEQSLDVSTEVQDVSVGVLRAVEWPNFLKRILWHLDTEQGGNEINRLRDKRADNDNEIKKAA